MQTNKFNLKSRPAVSKKPDDNAKMAGPVQRKPDKDILEHNSKREIEVKLAELEDKLDEQGWGSSE